MLQKLRLVLSYLIEVHADVALPVLAEICGRISVWILLSIALKRLSIRLFGICWLCLIAMMNFDGSWRFVWARCRRR